MPTASSPELELPLDELSQLQLRIARRADEIASQRGDGPALNLHYWLLAETEICLACGIDDLQAIPNARPRSIESESKAG